MKKGKLSLKILSGIALGMGVAGISNILLKGSQEVTLIFLTIAITCLAWIKANELF